MNRRPTALVAVAAVAVPLAFSAPAGASTSWVCNVPGEGWVTFVTADDHAQDGIETANGRAGQTFHERFGEVCIVESS
jgi:hypothetical protein